MVPLANSTKHLKEKIILILHNLSQKREIKEILSNSFYQAIMTTTTQNQRHYQKKKTTGLPLVVQWMKTHLPMQGMLPGSSICREQLYPGNTTARPAL